MRRLREQVAELGRLRRAPATVSAYASDWRDFETWCASAGRIALPASAETLELYLADRMRALKASSLQRRVAAVAAAHEDAGHASPYTRRVKDFLRGVRRKFGARVDQAAPLSVEDLRIICRALPGSLPSPEGRSAALRDRCIFTLGFAAAMRRSELVGLDVRDLVFSAAGVEVTIRRSKTDQEARGRKVGVFFGTRGAASCPVRCLAAWLKVRGPGSGPLFPGSGASGRLTVQAVNLIVKRGVCLAGLDPALYSAHSLRAGFCTYAAGAGVPDTLTMKTTGHRRADTLAGYVRPLFGANVLSKAL